jgi:glycosyltransferase involved in cell wall biosynthesis
MKKNNFILSIVIPTRNRDIYVNAAVLQVLENTPNDVQVVVQDNSDHEVFMNNFKDSSYFHRIKYNYSPGQLSFVDNFSKAVEIAEGEYLCMIGDDDGINPEIATFVHWAKENGIEAISPEIKLNYIWPNTGIKYYKTDNGNLTIVNFDLKSKIYNTESEIRKLLDSGGQNYLNYNLVKIYHGIVKKEAMDRVKSKTGKYFGGLSPDIYSSVALSLVVDKVLKINYPLTIPGVCRKSGSGHSSTGRHHGELDTAPQLKGHINYQWSSLVPRFYSVETLWADSAVAAFSEMKRDDLVKKFNVIQLSVYCFLKNKEFNKYSNKNLDEYCELNNINSFAKKTLLFKHFIKGPIYDLLNRVKSRIKRKKSDISRYENIETISMAAVKLEKYLKDNSLSIGLLIKMLNKENSFK